MRPARRKLRSCIPASAAALIALIALVAARTAHADDLTGSLDKPPELPVYDLGFRLKLVEAVIGKDFNLVPAGFGLDFSARVSSQWSIGAVSNLDMYISDLGGDGSTFTSRLQVGAEARYLLSDGHGRMRVNHGPWQTIPSLGWLTLSGGYETFGFVFGKASGAFANVGYLSELYIGQHFNFGMVYTVGATYDPPVVYGYRSDSLFHATGSIGFRFAWGT